MKLYQQYILMSPSVFEEHFKEQYPDAVNMGGYRLAPFLNIDRFNVEKFCTDNGITFNSPHVSAIIEQIETDTGEVTLTDIDTVLAVKSHFEPIELGEDSAV